MRALRTAFWFASLVVCFSSLAAGREWADASGQYSVKADLVAFNDATAILKRDDHELVAFPLSGLSEQDKKYLDSDEAKAIARQFADQMSVWKLADGSEVVGRIVDYANRDITLQRRHGRNYVNDRRLENLPEFYQRLIPKIVAHKEELPRADLRGLRAWLVRQRGVPRTFHVDGIVMEAENGDEYAIPFFLFSEEDQRWLTPRWDAWNEATRSKEYGVQREIVFLLESLAAARQRDREILHDVAALKLQMQAVQAGVTSLWEVTLWPAPDQPGLPAWVVVPARDSRQATAAALEQHPGFVAGPVRRVSRSRVR
jgi:hypothetical protein